MSREVNIFLDKLFNAFQDHMAAEMTCEEAEVTADLYRAEGFNAEADDIIEAHSYGDIEPEDDHYRGEEIAEGA